MTESDSSYNGWTNYETWLVNLWLNNDEETYNLCRSMAESCFEEAVANEVLNREERACYILANRLKEMLEERNPLSSEASVYADLVNAALCEVNWREIAIAFSGEIDND